MKFGDSNRARNSELEQNSTVMVTPDDLGQSPSKGEILPLTCERL